MANYDLAYSRYWENKLSSDPVYELLLPELWHKMRLDRINSQDVADVVFSIGVTMGINPGGRSLQMSVNEIRFKNLRVDGIIGSNTINAVNEIKDSSVLTNTIVEKWKDRYMTLIKNNPKLRTFKKGWINRANSYRVESNNKDKYSIVSFIVRGDGKYAEKLVKEILKSNTDVIGSRINGESKTLKEVKDLF